MTESTTSTMNHDDQGTVVHDQLEAAQSQVDQLEEQVAQAEAQSSEASRKVSTQQALLSSLQAQINGGNIGAAAEHSQASAALTGLERNQHNYRLALQSLRAQLTQAQLELELFNALSGHSDIISVRERATDLAEAQTAIRAILEPLVRKYRKSDSAYRDLAETYKRYLRTNSVGLQGITGTGLGRAETLIFDDGTTLDDMGSHHAKRVTERVLTNINADIQAEIRGAIAPRN